MITQDDIHTNPDWQTVGKWSYNVAAPSGRILHALEAMKIFEDAPHLGIRMSCYRTRDSVDGICYACCGGAARCVIEGWCKEGQFAQQWPIETQENDYEMSLDWVRVGAIGGMFEMMGLPAGKGISFTRSIPRYTDDRKGFYKAMRKLAKDLAEAGW